MIRRQADGSARRPDLNDLARFAGSDKRDGRFFEVATVKRPKAVSGTHRPSRLRSVDCIDDLLAWHAKRREIDVLHDHHLVVLLDKHGAVEDLLDILSVARREVAERLLHALGRLVQALALHVLAQFLQELRDQLRDLSVFAHYAASPSYWNRFLAVSTTVTRRSAPAGTAGASRRQNARASPSPVVTTPASAGTSSSVRWSTRSSTRWRTAPSICSRSTDIPVTGSGRPATVTSR